ncbi:helix-turn-helix domain-containing protein [Cellulosimicrobium sp. 22601]|uniref:helix-turn-helix domain-containing protein n=1 Tax=unclassified Cellulosimicrobium TaxID=2624466 RepID=UPI003F83C449
MASRTRARPARRRWWSVEVAPGEYARVVAWTSRDSQLAAIDAAAAASGWRSPRRASFVDVVRVLVDVADPTTGRDVTVSAASIGERVGVSVRTVFRRLADARAAGLLVDVVRGRHTTRDERQRAHDATGRLVHRFATVRALTHPAGVAVTPTRSRSERGISSRTTSPSARRARTTTTRRRARTTAQAPRPLALQREAAHLAARWPWLAPSGTRHVGHVVAVLQRHDLTAHDAVELVDAWHTTTHRTSLGRDAAQPVAWLAWTIRQARAAGHETARERRRRDDAERTERRALRAAERAEDEQRRISGQSDAARTARMRIRQAIADVGSSTSRPVPPLKLPDAHCLHTGSQLTVIPLSLTNGGRP